MKSLLLMAIEKMLKSEYWVTLIGMAAMALSKTLGLPDEVLSEFIYSVTGIVVAYIGQRGVVKAKEATAALKAEVAAELPK